MDMGEKGVAEDDVPGSTHGLTGEEAASRGKEAVSGGKEAASGGEDVTVGVGAALVEGSDKEFDHVVNDALMRFFDHCTRFVQEVDQNPTALSEVDKFRQGPEMRRVTEKIADSLRVPYNTINDDMAEAAFYLCAYEFAIKTVNSPWCQLFDVVDAQVMEYANDLKQFWKRGYGYDINSKSSCILFHDVFSRLNRAADENKSGQQVTEAVTVQVGHAETLLPLLTLLGFFKNNGSITSTNYATQTQRSFRTSHMLPYAANLLLVLYDCGAGELRLQALLNEKPTECQLFKSPA
ncbi:hypothetical protein JOQ06_021168 [Pogonophryne albipinna]|uniref:Multiple inositol polyphosphate phosphatase 1 n=1 Tax=Pogonophryne albipinna TaxID=1090488 RepID=A0AAD6BSC5_9TELE|nr:hypothetical protein JOQ06_021168 [Pogonophryne albipinna]